MHIIIDLKVENFDIFITTPPRCPVLQRTLQVMSYANMENTTY